MSSFPVYLLRHTAVEAPGLCYGHHDVPLAATFAADAAAVRASLLPVLPADGPAPHLFSSPATRCQRLAESLQIGPAALDERLREMHFGTWENRPWNDLPPAEINPWMVDYENSAPPTGETFGQLHTRAAAFLATLENLPAPAVVVTHGGTVRALLCHCLGIPLRNAFQLEIGFGSRTALRRQHGRWQVLGVNL